MIAEKLHILLIDNYDSFSYNLVELLRKFDQVKVTLLKNDDLAIFRDEYHALIISPGPGLPNEAAFLLDALDYYIGRIPIFGVCLGLQAIVEQYGGNLAQLESVFHGIKDDLLHYENSIIFDEIDLTFKAGRYHSWVAEKNSLPSKLEITAVDNAGTIMAIQNKVDNCYAVQFHPESFMTPEGHKMFQNFIALVSKIHSEKQLPELV